MSLFAILILALAISLDGFVVGITYGLKKIKIGLLPILIISIASGVTMLFSMSLGEILANFLPSLWATRIGGLLLIVVGAWVFYQSLIEFLHDNTDNVHSGGPKELFTLEINSLGLIVNILHEPIKADIDYSGTISNKEALFLGIALALDAFGAGIAAAMTGYYPISTALAVGVVKFCLLTGGIYLGKHIQSSLLGNKIKLLPGLILIFLGILKFI